MTAHILDNIFDSADEAERIEHAEEMARKRGALVAAWLQLIVETHRGEASIEIRRGAVVPILSERVRTAADLKFMRPRRQHGTDDPADWSDALGRPKQ